MGHPAGAHDREASEGALEDEVTRLRDQLAELRLSHDVLGREVAAERDARACSEPFSALTSDSSTAPTPSVVPPLGAAGGAGMFRPHTSPRHVAEGRSPCNSERLVNSMSTRGASSARSPPRSPPRRSSSRGRPLPSPSAKTSSGNGVVVVEISRQLWDMEEKWQRICAETAALKAILRETSPVRSRGGANSGESLFPTRIVGGFGAPRDSAATVAAAAAAGAAVHAAAAAYARTTEVPTSPLQAYHSDTLEETRLCGPARTRVL